MSTNDTITIRREDVPMLAAEAIRIVRDAPEYSGNSATRDRITAAIIAAAVEVPNEQQAKRPCVVCGNPEPIHCLRGYPPEDGHRTNVLSGLSACMAIHDHVYAPAPVALPSLDDGGIPSEPKAGEWVRMPDQRSVTDQLRDLRLVAIGQGMYDAADWLSAHEPPVPSEATDFKLCSECRGRGCDKCNGRGAGRPVDRCCEDCIADGAIRPEHVNGCFPSKPDLPADAHEQYDRAFADGLETARRAEVMREGVPAARKDCPSKGCPLPANHHGPCVYPVPAAPKVEPNPSDCTCEHTHASSRSCRSVQPSRGAISENERAFPAPKVDRCVGVDGAASARQIPDVPPVASAPNCAECQCSIVGEVVETVEGPVGNCCVLPHEDDLRRSELEMILDVGASAVDVIYCALHPDQNCQCVEIIGKSVATAVPPVASAEAPRVEIGASHPIPTGWTRGGAGAVLVAFDGTPCPTRGQTLCTITDPEHLHTFMSRVGSHAMELVDTCYGMTGGDLYVCPRSRNRTVVRAQAAPPTCECGFSRGNWFAPEDWREQNLRRSEEADDVHADHECGAESEAERLWCELDAAICNLETVVGSPEDNPFLGQLVAELRAIHDRLSAPSDSSATPASTEPVMDWEQVRLNGGPPCYAVLPDAPGRYCGRAERWPGHPVDHPFIAGPATPTSTPKIGHLGPCTESCGCNWATPASDGEGLKACPFCGEDTVGVQLWGASSVFCNGCGIAVSCHNGAPLKRLTEEVIAAWNRRSVPAPDLPQDRHTGQNAHPCCEHDPARNCCDNHPGVDLNGVAEEMAVWAEGLQPT